jgi:hypothetical protein
MNQSDFFDEPSSSLRRNMKKRNQCLFMCLIRKRCYLLSLLATSLALAASLLLAIWFVTADDGSTDLVNAPLQRILIQGRAQQSKVLVEEIEGDNPSECFRYNSLEWLHSPRLGNANDASVDVSLARRTIVSSLSLSRARIFLSRTICDSKSPFVSMQTVGDHGKMLRHWKARLVFLAIHAHQNQPALPEVQKRNQQHCQNEMSQHNIGPFDFECPTAKFLVVRLFSNGIGANMRLAAVPAFMAGLATNRVVVFVNNAPVGPDFLKNPWTLASCPRGDMQCFFMPSTPCILTQDELSNAPVLRKDELRLIFRNGTLLQERQQERVLILRLSFRPQREPDNLRRALHQIALPIAQTLAQDANAQEQSTILQAADELLQPDTIATETYNYYGANSPLFHGLLFYAMRPNQRAALALQSIVKQSLPKDYASEHSIGLPIRASDKCDVESECMSFSQYLRSVAQLWKWNETGATSIVVTTESQKVMKELNDIVAKEKSTADLPFPVRFVVNKHDVLQDSGFLQKQTSNYTQYEAMLSAISSFQLQLTTRLTVGNCCSNFHLLLSDFLREGCGLIPNNQFHCLQDHPDPDFRLCCQWDKSVECVSRRNQTSTIA